MIKTKILSFFNLDGNNDLNKLTDIALIGVSKPQRKYFLKKIKLSVKSNPDKLKSILLNVSQNKASIDYLAGFISARV